MSNLLELEQDDYIKYDNKILKIISRLKFVEGPSYWFEYILIEEETNKKYYLDIEPIGKCTIHEMINEKIEIDIEVNYEEEKYILKQKGHAIVDTYYGYTDVYLKEPVDYYEYISEKDKDKILTIERWKKDIEISIGKNIYKNSIKIIKRKEL